MLKTGSAADLPSRADAGGPLTGQKRLAVEQQVPMLTRGRRDGRTVVMVPERVDGASAAITLCTWSCSRRRPRIACGGPSRPPATGSTRSSRP